MVARGGNAGTWSWAMGPGVILDARAGVDESGPLGEEALTPSEELDVGHKGEGNEG